MGKTNKTAIVTIRVSPAEKQAAADLADRLGLSITDVIRLSLNETLQRKNGSVIFNFSEVFSDQGVKNG